MRLSPDLEEQVEPLAEVGVAHADGEGRAGREAEAGATVWPRRPGRRGGTGPAAAAGRAPAGPRPARGSGRARRGRRRRRCGRRPRRRARSRRRPRSRSRRGISWTSRVQTMPCADRALAAQPQPEVLTSAAPKPRCLEPGRVLGQFHRAGEHGGRRDGAILLLQRPAAEQEERPRSPPPLRKCRPRCSSRSCAPAGKASCPTRISRILPVRTSGPATARATALRKAAPKWTSGSR